MLFHGYHLYDVCTKYKLLILSLDRKYTWSFLSILYMRHRLSLSGWSAQFYVIDSVLFNWFMDPTTVKTSAAHCYRCKSFDHTIGKCPFPMMVSTSSTPKINTGRAHHPTSYPNSPGKPAVCNNFNNLHCVLNSCKRLHVSRWCWGTSHMSSAPSKVVVQQTRPFLKPEFWINNYLPIFPYRVYRDELCIHILYGLPIGVNSTPLLEIIVIQATHFMLKSMILWNQVSCWAGSRVLTMHFTWTLRLLPLVPSSGIIATRYDPSMILVGPQIFPLTVE